jgi:hypothetical protein
MEAALQPAPVAGESNGDEAAVVVESKAGKEVSIIRATAEDAESAGLPMIKFDGNGKRMHLVSQQFINELELEPPLPRLPARPLSNERLLRFVDGDKADYAILIKGFEAAEAIWHMETDILKQYHDKGYAYFVIADEV